jgi:hypothetical protein
MTTQKELTQAIEAAPARSAWSKGVKLYALELIEAFPDDREFYGSPADKKGLLNGAQDWKEYSYGGCSLIYNEDIAKRLCTPSEYKRTKAGRNNPNARENWLDVQARALYQAAEFLCRLSKD